MIWFIRKKKKKQEDAENLQAAEQAAAEPQPEDPVPAPEPEPVPETMPEPVAAIEPAPEPEPEPEPESAPEPEPVPETTSAPVSELEHVPEPQPEYEPQPESESSPTEDAAPAIVTTARAAPDAETADDAEELKSGWFTRLKDGLSRSSNKITDSISSVITKKKLDDETLEELEEALITADLGPATAAKLVAELAGNRFGKDITEQEVREELAKGIEKILDPVMLPLQVAHDVKPCVILVVGVNGTGKTTTIGKLAHILKNQGHKVMMGAGDTFRAAAVEQLQVWGDRTGCGVIAKDIGADAGALAYEAFEQAKAEDADILLLDTAGRLQNKANLMAELEKIGRVLKKHDESAPHGVLLVLDATTGQNAHSQVELFDKTVPVSGLIVTKLDGSARGGVLVSLAERFGLPVHAIGIGEGIDDLRPFEARAFARSLMGLD